MKKKSITLLIIMVVSLFLAGCGSPSVRPPGPSINDNLRTLPGTSTDTGYSTDSGFSMPISEWEQSGTKIPENELDENFERMQWTNPDGTAIVVYFAFDSSQIGDTERPKLERLAEWMLANSGTAVIIEGHTDAIGDEEYNRGLSERRALSVKDYLVRLGVSDTRIETIAYGEDKLVIPNATTNAEHAKNRRAEFILKIPRAGSR